MRGESTVFGAEQGWAIVGDRCQIPAEVSALAARFSSVCNATLGDERVQKGVAERSKRSQAPASIIRLARRTSGGA